MAWRLLTIRVSHYNEKARWALDRAGLAYDERPWMPLLHMPAVAARVLPRRAGARDKTSTRLSTPVLVTDDELVTDSSDIVAFASREGRDPSGSLVDDAEAVAFDRRLSGRFGADTRMLAYAYLLPERHLFVELGERSVPAAQAKLFRLLAPMIGRMLHTRMRLDPEQVGKARSRVMAEFAAISERLADGRPYLLGDRFTAADLSFAALSAPVLMVQPSEGFGAWLPGPEQVPAGLRELSEELRVTPAGRFALRMFAEERGERLRPCAGP